MWLFNRRKKQNNIAGLPPEVQAYTQAEHRERMGMAWLVGIISLLVSLLIVTGLFFGGRWLYRKVSHTTNKPVPVVTDETKKTEEDKDTSGDTETTPSENGTNNGTTTTPTTPAAPSAPSTTPSTQPVTGDAQLPSTGPDVDL